MRRPTDEDWSFDAINAENNKRGLCLESAGSGEDLIARLTSALTRSFERKHFRIGFDSKKNAWEESRIIFQFKIPIAIYDWFFNGRDGYRAHYWVSPEIGNKYNSQLTEALTKIIIERFSSPLKAYKIHSERTGDSRTDKIVGTDKIDSTFLKTSLQSPLAKIWICERLIQPDKTSDRIEEIGFSILSSAERGAKLIIPRWQDSAHGCSREKGEGLRSPYPKAEYSWLDVKGGFVSADGKTQQEKSHDTRATSLHKCGWS